MQLFTRDPNNLVSVYGPGIARPLLQSNDVRLIQIRDAGGEPAMFIVRLTDALWGASFRGDPDWEDHKKRLLTDDLSVSDTPSDPGGVH